MINLFQPNNFVPSVKISQKNSGQATLITFFNIGSKRKADKKGKNSKEKNISNLSSIKPAKSIKLKHEPIKPCTNNIFSYLKSKNEDNEEKHLSPPPPSLNVHQIVPQKVSILIKNLHLF